MNNISSQTNLSIVLPNCVTYNYTIISMASCTQRCNSGTVLTTFRVTSSCVMGLKFHSTKGTYNVLKICSYSIFFIINVIESIETHPTEVSEIFSNNSIFFPSVGNQKKKKTGFVHLFVFIL